MLYRTPKADQYTLDALKASADIIEEVDALTTYVGFFQPGISGTNEEKKADEICAIMKIVQSAEDGVFPNITEVTFCDGIMGYNKVWNNRAGYTYKFKNF